MDSVREDAINGVVDYNPITMEKTFDPEFKRSLDMMTPQARELEIQQREMMLLSILIPIKMPEEWEAFQKIMNDPEFERQFMENYQRNVAEWERNTQKK